MDNKPSRSSGLAPPATANPSVVHSTRKSFGIDVRYLSTIPGILKIAELCIGIICAAVCGAAYWSGNRFFLFVTITCIIITFILLLLNFFKITKLSLPFGIRWNLIECGYAAIACGFYLCAASVQVARTSLGESGIVDIFTGTVYSLYNRYMAAGIIAFLNFLLYGADAAFHYKEYRDNRLQGPV